MSWIAPLRGTETNAAQLCVDNSMHRHQCVPASHDTSIGGPTGQLGAIRQLQLAQYGADMGLHGFDGDEQFRGDLLIRVAACDKPHDLLLAVRQPVQLIIVD